MNTKRCGNCHTERPITDFTTSPSFRDGLYPVCRACRAVLWQERKARNPEAMRTKAHEAVQRWRENPANRAKEANRIATKRAAYSEEEAKAERMSKREIMGRPVNQRRSKNRYTLGNYGLTLEEYESISTFLLESRQRRCGACV